MQNEDMNGTAVPPGDIPITDVKKLYASFVTACVEQRVMNTVVAQASIAMLTDALANMSNASLLAQETYSDIMGEATQYLQNVAMDLSHDIADAVNTAQLAADGETKTVNPLASLDALDGDKH